MPSIEYEAQKWKWENGGTTNICVGERLVICNEMFKAIVNDCKKTNRVTVSSFSIGRVYNLVKDTFIFIL